VLSLVIFATVIGVAAQLYVEFGNHIETAENLPHIVKRVSYVLYHATYRLIKSFLPTIHNPDIALLAIMVFILPLPMIIFSLSRKHSKGTISVYALLLLSVALTRGLYRIVPFGGLIPLKRFAEEGAGNILRRIIYVQGERFLGYMDAALAPLLGGYRTFGLALLSLFALLIHAIAPCLQNHSH